MSETLKWTLRVSRKARYARLQIKPFGGLEVVIPPRFPRYQIPGLVEQHADWARTQLEKQSCLRESISLPDRIDLPFDNSSTGVTYVDRTGFTGDLFEHQPDDDRISVSGIGEEHCIQQLRQWIRNRARDLLPPVVEKIARRSGLEYGRVTIRSQKSRWGSCSSRGNINLNDQLLFVPPECADYLVIHELCHTQQMNHSRAFWKLVETHCPDYRLREKQLGQSRQWVPDWFLLDLYR